MGIGIVVPDDGLEDYVRDVGGLPERTADTRVEDTRRIRQRNQSQPPEEEHEKENDEPTEEEVRAAKSRIGRKD